MFQVLSTVLSLILFVPAGDIGSADPYSMKIKEIRENVLDPLWGCRSGSSDEKFRDFYNSHKYLSSLGDYPKERLCDYKEMLEAAKSKGWNTNLVYESDESCRTVLMTRMDVKSMLIDSRDLLIDRMLALIETTCSSQVRRWKNNQKGVHRSMCSETR